MTKTVRVLVLVVMSLFMAFSSIIVASAEDNLLQEQIEYIDSSDSDDSEDISRAYELVWKYKRSDIHLWKRRWNATLGGWYDPDWILVY